MTLEDFIDIHKDKDLMTKIYWLAKSVELRERDFAKASEARTYGYAKDIAEYYEREAWHMNDRIEWLWEEIEKEVKEIENCTRQTD